MYNSVTSDFIYGADGLRRRSTIGSTVTDYVLDGQSAVQEGHVSSGNFVVDATYLTGLRGPECRIDSSGVATWYIFDGLGSVVGEANGSGTITASRKLDVYGLLREAEAGTPTSDHKFVGSLGHTSEGETGLIYMRARYMDPALGRFISEDPARDGANWFVYCGNNPTNIADADGQAALPLIAIRLLTRAILAIGFLGGGSSLMREDHPFVAHVTKAMAAMVAAYDAASKALLAASMMDSYRSPTGSYTAAGAAAALGILATVMTAVAVEQVALAILVSTDPTSYDKTPKLF